MRTSLLKLFLSLCISFCLTHPLQGAYEALPANHDIEREYPFCPLYASIGTAVTGALLLFTSLVGWSLSYSKLSEICDEEKDPNESPLCHPESWREGVRAAAPVGALFGFATLGVGVIMYTCK